MTNEMKDKKILIVEAIEDDVLLRNALNDKLSLEGFGVIEAKDGEEGLVVALRDHPDLILLDIIMPKLDGMAMLKKLREDEWGKSARVIILTNLDDVSKVAEAMGNEVFEYYIKSDTSIESIVAKVKEKLYV